MCNVDFNTKDLSATTCNLVIGKTIMTTKPQAEQTVSEIIDGLLAEMENKPDVAAGMMTDFDYGEVVEDQEYEEPFTPRYFM